MRYSPRHYAEAFYEALGEKTGKARAYVFENFYRVLRKNGDLAIKNLIFSHFEKIYLKKHNMRKLDIESAKPLDAKIKKSIEDIINAPVMLTEKHNPDLIAGMTMLLDDSLFIDASARTKINKLFIHP
jgi:F0F1-type ATP synthase delta subunit